MPDCLFCKLVSGQIPSTRIHEDLRTLVVMDINPASRGHCLVLSKEHYQDLLDLPEDLWSHTAQVAQRIARAAKIAFACEGVNLLQATGRAAFQTIFHFHLHVIPRWSTDGIVAPWKLTPGDPKAIQQAGAELRSALAG